MVYFMISRQASASALELRSRKLEVYGVRQAD